MSEVLSSVDAGVSGVNIKTIDLTDFLRPDATPEERRAIAMEVGAACEEIGFLVITGHGVPDDVIDNAWTSTARFFDRPEEEKRLMVTHNEKEYPFGYSVLGGEILSSGKDAESNKISTNSSPDLKEMFSLGPADPASGFPTRRWPTNPPEFEPAMTAYYDALNQLANSLLQAMAIALDLGDEHYFERFVDHHASALRTLNYPHLEGYVPQPGQLRASAHTDYGTITVLRTDFPGLQVSKDKNPPQWVDVPFVPGAFIVNLGDLMHRWTGDKWLSTLHRVVNPSEEVCLAAGVLNDYHGPGKPVRSAEQPTRRQSMAFFHNLNRDAVVETLPSTTPVKQYEPIVAGDFLMLKHLAATQGK